jgi:hypothetical protein
MPIVNDDQMVQAFPPDTSDHTLYIAILPRASCRYRNVFDAQTFYSRNEVMTVDSISIPYQITWCAVVGKRFDDLLRSPNGRGVLRHIKMQNTATVVRQDDEDVQHM